MTNTLHSDLSREALEDKLEDLIHERSSLRGCYTPGIQMEAEDQDDLDNIEWEISHIERLLKRPVETPDSQE